MRRKFYVPFGEEDEHARKLVRGLALMPSNFVAELCIRCRGRTQHRQMYTAGCGGGYFHSMGECEACDGTGLTVCYTPAPESVLNQVLEASSVDKTAKAAS